MKRAIAIEEKVIAEILQKDTMTTGGLYIPEVAEKEPQTYAKVISVGQKVTSIKTGDIIIAAKHGGQAFMLNDKVMKCYMLGEIYSVIEEVKDNG